MGYIRCRKDVLGKDRGVWAQVRGVSGTDTCRGIWGIGRDRCMS